MEDLNYEARVVTGQSQDKESIGNEALAAMQKAMEEIDNLTGISKENTPEEDIKNEEQIEENANEDEDETVEEVEVKKEKPISKESKYRKLQNDKYRALAEKEELAEKLKEAAKKNEDLEKMLTESLNSGAYHYGRSAQAELERAKQNKKIAIENGDVNALIEADIALTEALTALNESKKWTFQNEQNNAVNSSVKQTNNSSFTPQASPKSSQVSYDHDAIKQEIAKDWLDSHSYLQPRSKDYNANLAQQVSDFVTHLDDNLRQNDQMDLYFTDDYFDTIDEFITKNINKPKAKIDRAAVSASHIGGVRRSHAPAVNGSRPSNVKVELTDDEKFMAKMAGISEASWRTQKEQDVRQRR